MPYAESDRLRIHYRVEGEGPPLVLQHGFTLSLDAWVECGYVAALREGFRLILVDARGHGASDKPHHPAAYALARRVGDVVAVLDALGVARAHFWGYSMGGWIGFGLAQSAPQRLDRLVVGGQHPYAGSFEALRELVQTGVSEGEDAFVAATERLWGFEANPEVRDDLSGADLEAWAAAVAEDRASLEDLLPAMRMPCCLYAGEADPFCRQAEAASRSIPGARFFALPGLSHAEAFERSDLSVPRVVSFLRGEPVSADT